MLRLARQSESYTFFPLGMKVGNIHRISQSCHLHFEDMMLPTKKV